MKRRCRFIAHWDTNFYLMKVGGMIANAGLQLLSDFNQHPLEAGLRYNNSVMGIRLSQENGSLSISPEDLILYYFF